MTNRWIELDGVVNMRDLGGLPLRGGGHTAYGRVIRSDNLRDLTPSAVRDLLETHGVTDVVDLRSDAERALEGSGPLRDRIAHHELSLLNERRVADIASAALALPWVGTGVSRDEDFWTAHYLRYLTARPDSVSAALASIASARGATIVHCAAGKDRTGTIVAMALDVAGVPREAIIDDYVLTATRLVQLLDRLGDRPAYRDALAQQSFDEQLPRPAAMAGTLEALAAYGGSAGWLREHGWSAPAVDALAGRLRA